MLKPRPMFHFYVYQFNNAWYRLLPQLREHVSPWHVVMKDVYILQCNCTKVDEIEHDFRPYIKEHLKGAILFLNTSFLVVLK